MTTIILENDKKIKRKTFKDIKDLYSYIVENSFITELWELSESEISPDLRIKLELAKKLKDSDFVDISFK